MKLQQTQRLGYIDALRGFTMILVVVAHVALHGLGVDTASPDTVHYYLQQFRMPLFFFVSGFVFYKSGFLWDWSGVRAFLSKKFVVQILSPSLFFLCFMYCNGYAFLGSVIGSNKLGYWFTFTLFAFFLLYVAMRKLFEWIGLGESTMLLLMLAVGYVLYHAAPYVYANRYALFSSLSFWAGVFGIGKMKFFLFFVVGVCVKRHFGRFEQFLDNSLLVPVAVFLFLAVNVFVDVDRFGSFLGDSARLLLALCGIVAVFALFRRHRVLFDGGGRLSLLLRFIGRRTLDIYLLHYFFILPGLREIVPSSCMNSMPLSEFALSFVIAAVIIAACVAVSSFFRLSPALGHFLFGAPKRRG